MIKSCIGIYACLRLLTCSRTLGHTPSQHFVDMCCKADHLCKRRIVRFSISEGTGWASDDCLHSFDIVVDVLNLDIFQNLCFPKQARCFFLKEHAALCCLIHPCGTLWMHIWDCGASYVLVHVLIYKAHIDCYVLLAEIFDTSLRFV